MQNLLNECVKYGQKWKITFNPLKSKEICFGDRLITDVELFLEKSKIPFTDQTEILGFILDSKNMEANGLIREKFKIVRKSFFALIPIGMKPGGLNIFLQSYIYKSYCLSRILYGLENMSFNEKGLSLVRFRFRFSLFKINLVPFGKLH